MILSRSIKRNHQNIAHPQSLQCAPILRCLSLVSRSSLTLPLRQAWLQGSSVLVSPLWGLACYGMLWLLCCVLVSSFVSDAAFWSVLWTDANAQRVANSGRSAFRSIPAVVLSATTLRSSLRSRHSTQHHARQTRLRPVTAFPTLHRHLPHTRCLHYSFYSCHAPINTEVCIFQYVESPPRTYANFSQHFAAFVK